MAGTFSIPEGIFGLLGDIIGSTESVLISREESEASKARSQSQATIAGAALEAQALSSIASQRNLIIAGVIILGTALIIGITRR